MSKNTLNFFFFHKYLAVNPDKANPQKLISQAIINHPINRISPNILFNTILLNSSRIVYLIQVCYNKIMPKIVDHEKRKIKIAEATWKVIVYEGIENAKIERENV